MNLDNSPSGYYRDTNPEALGIPQFSGDSFYQVFNGIVVQGGKATAGATGDFNVPFVAPFRQQLLTVQVHRIDVANHIHVVSAGTTLTNLRVHLTGAAGSFYWFAMGV